MEAASCTAAAGKRTNAWWRYKNATIARETNPAKRTHPDTSPTSYISLVVITASAANNSLVGHCRRSPKLNPNPKMPPRIDLTERARDCLEIPKADTASFCSQHGRPSEKARRCLLTGRGSNFPTGMTRWSHPVSHVWLEMETRGSVRLLWALVRLLSALLPSALWDPCGIRGENMRLGSPRPGLRRVGGAGEVS